MLDINNVKDLLKILSCLKECEDKKESSTFLIIGKSYFIRTVTMNHIGRLININDKELLLEDASWIADSGRFHNALKDGELDEVEPFVSNVIINRDCIIDITEWLHKIPRSQK